MSDKTSKISVGIVGGAGYTGGELLRILLRHPQVEIAFVQSSSNAGKPVISVHNDLTGDTELVFSGKVRAECDALFLCVGHGEAARWTAANSIGNNCKIIDLSQDHRYSGNPEFVYGLPELWREKIRTQRQHIANPGCFATAIQLALLPLAAGNFLHTDIHVTAVTGSTGAGQSLAPTSHFSWRAENVQVYKPFSHQHLHEITSSLSAVSAIPVPPVHFIPVRGNFTRGIHASAVTKIPMDKAGIVGIFDEFYSTHPFVTVLPDGLPDLKMTTQTNKCVIGIESKDGMALIVSVLDNLLKGASGQAVQNLNILFGFPEDAGLRLKSAGF